MPISTLIYEPPVRRSMRSAALDYELLETAVTLYDQGRALDALVKVFAHLFPGAQPPSLQTEAFTFVQGSSRVTTRIEGDDLLVSIPLARLPEGGKGIAALRFLLTKMSGPGQLYQPRLRGDDVYLEFRDRLARLHPAKLIEVLQRMPVMADNNDDWLIGQFGALPLERADITPLDDAEAARADAIWRAHWRDVEELLKESQRKRSIFFLNEVTAYAIHHIKFALPLGGFLGSRLDESAAVFNDGEQDPDKREASLARCIKEMKAVSEEQLRNGLGHATYAISPYGNGTPAVISEYLGRGNYLSNIEQHKSSGKSLEAALGLIATYNYLLRRFSWPEAVEAELKSGLEQASGKSWRDAASILLHHASQLVEKLAGGEDEEEGEDGAGGEKDGEQ